MGERIEAPVTIAVIALFVGFAVTRLSAPMQLVLLAAVVVSGLIAARSARRDESNSAEHDVLKSFAKWWLFGGLATSGLTVIRLPGGFTFSDWLFAVAAFLTVLSFLRGAHRRVEEPTVVLVAIGALMLIFGGVISAAASQQAVASLEVLARIIVTAVVLVWLAGAALNNQRDLQRAAALWCGSIAVSGAGALLALLTGWTAPGAQDAWGRYSGFAEHPNDLGAMCAIALPIALYLATRRRVTPSMRMVSIVVLALTATGGILSGSITFIVAAAIGVLSIAALQRFRPRALLSTVALLFVGLMVASTLAASGAETPFERFNFLAPGGDTAGSTLGSRRAVDAVAWAQIQEHPLVGTGFGQGLTELNFEVHNLFLQAWFEGGILALLGLLAILSAIALRAHGSITLQPRRSDGRDLAVALTASFISFLVFSVAALLIYKRFAWIAPSLVSAAYLVALRNPQVSEDWRLGAERARLRPVAFSPDDAGSSGVVIT